MDLICELLQVSTNKEVSTRRLVSTNKEKKISFILSLTAVWCNLKNYFIATVLWSFHYIIIKVKVVSFNQTTKPTEKNRHRIYDVCYDQLRVATPTHLIGQ